MKHDCTTVMRHNLLGALDLLCLDSNHAACFATVSALEELNTSGVFQLSHVSDALLVYASLLLSLLADTLHNLQPYGLSGSKNDICETQRVSGTSDASLRAHLLGDDSHMHVLACYLRRAEPIASGTRHVWTEVL